MKRFIMSLKTLGIAFAMSVCKEVWTKKGTLTADLIAHSQAWLEKKQKRLDELNAELKEPKKETGAVDSVSRQPRMPQSTGHQFNFEISVPEHIVEFNHPGNPARSARVDDRFWRRRYDDRFWRRRY